MVPALVIFPMLGALASLAWLSAARRRPALQMNASRRMIAAWCAIVSAALAGATWFLTDAYLAIAYAFCSLLPA